MTAFTTTNTKSTFSKQESSLKLTLQKTRVTKFKGQSSTVTLTILHKLHHDRFSNRSKIWFFPR